VHRGRLSRQHEDARANDGANAEHRQVDWPKHAHELGLASGARLQVVNRFRCQ
jgi:hypothetical protein